MTKEVEETEIRGTTLADVYDLTNDNRRLFLKRIFIRGIILSSIIAGLAFFTTGPFRDGFRGSWTSWLAIALLLVILACVFLLLQNTGDLLSIILIIFGVILVVLYYGFRAANWKYVGKHGASTFVVNRSPAFVIDAFATILVFLVLLILAIFAVDFTGLMIYVLVSGLTIAVTSLVAVIFAITHPKEFGSTVYFAFVRMIFNSICMVRVIQILVFGERYLLKDNQSLKGAFLTVIAPFTLAAVVLCYIMRFCGLY